MFIKFRNSDTQGLEIIYNLSDPRELCLGSLASSVWLLLAGRRSSAFLSTCHVGLKAGALKWLESNSINSPAHTVGARSATCPNRRLLLDFHAALHSHKGLAGVHWEEINSTSYPDSWGRVTDRECLEERSLLACFGAPKSMQQNVHSLFICCNLNGWH